MIWIVLTFGGAVFYLSLLIARNHARMEHSELAFYIVMIAWVSLLMGVTLVSHRVS
jgi:hypothetical protein